MATATIMSEANTVVRKGVKAHWAALKMMKTATQQPGDHIIFDSDIKAGVKYDVSFSQDGAGHEQVIFTPK